MQVQFCIRINQWFKCTQYIGLLTYNKLNTIGYDEWDTTEHV